MSDAYSDWLDIPPHLRPPTYYQVLGIAPTELDPQVIAAAADRRLAQVRPHESGPRAEEAGRLLREITQARDTLLDPVTRLRYDTLTPDAADPWWKAEGAATAPPPAPREPVEGWWQGEAPEPEPEPPVAPEPPPPRSDDWWKAPPAAPADVKPPPRPPAPPVRVTPSPPVPPAPSAAPGPMIREETLAFASPADRGSSAPWVFAGFAVVVLIATGVLVVMKPWERPAEEPADGPPVALNPPQSAPPAVAPRTVDPPPKKVDLEPPAKKEPVAPPEPPEPPEPKPKPKMEDPPPPPKKEPPKTEPKPDEVIVPVTFQGHKGGVTGLAISPTGQTILTVSDDQTVLHHAPAEPEKHGQLHRLGSPGFAVALADNGRLAAFADGGEVVVYDVPERKVKATYENPRGGIRSLAAAPDGRFVLAGTTDGVVRWWGTQSNTLEHELDIDEKATVSAVGIAPNGQTAVVGLSDGQVATWDLKQRRQLRRWPAHKGTVTTVQFSPDGRRIVSAGEDGVATVWQPSGTLVRKLAGHAGPVVAAWAADSRGVFTAGIDKTVRRWDEDRGWKSAWSEDLPDRAFSLAVDPRGRFVVVGLASGRARLLPLPAEAPGS